MKLKALRQNKAQKIPQKGVTTLSITLAIFFLSVSCGTPEQVKSQSKRQQGQEAKAEYSEEAKEIASRLYSQHAGLDIVDGSVADQKTLTSTVGIVGNGTLCSGTVIENGKIASAKHCYQNGNTRGLAIVFGGSIDQGQFVPVANVEVSKSRGLQDDVAVLTPASALPSFAQKIPLAPEGLDYSNTDVFTVAGFGTQQDGSRNGGSGIGKQALIQLKGELTSQKLLRSSYGNGQACFGDSGGPVYADIDGTRYLAGIVSFGSGGRCKSSDLFAVDTRFYRDFFLGDNQTPVTNPVEIANVMLPPKMEQVPGVNPINPDLQNPEVAKPELAPAIAQDNAEVDIDQMEKDKAAANDAEIDAKKAEQEAKITAAKLDREAKIAEIQAMRDAQKAEKEAKIAAALAEREAKKAELEAEREAKRAEREAKRAEREAMIAAKKAEREAKKTELEEASKLEVQKSEELVSCLSNAKMELQDTAKKLGKTGAANMEDFLSVAQAFLNKTKTCLSK